MIARKKCVTFLLSFVLPLTCSVITVNANDNTSEGFTAVPLYETIEPYWMNIVGLNTYLSFNNGCGSLGASVIGQTGTTQITGYAVLERFNSNGTYTQIASWNNLSATGNLLDFSKTYYVTRGYTYRLSFTATVYRNGTGETATGCISRYAD
ncbi:MAG: hypothetical protein LBB94_00320 [Clostridiales bacterium]|jgi:hypothetical protein|nr:hypothetical protein [Clostridiales bacterium]